MVRANPTLKRSADGKSLQVHTDVDQRGAVCIVAHVRSEQSAATGGKRAQISGRQRPFIGGSSAARYFRNLGAGEWAAGRGASGRRESDAQRRQAATSASLYSVWIAGIQVTSRP